MPESPKAIEEKLNTVIKAWKKLRPTKKFSGLTSDEFATAVQASFTHRARIIELETELTAVTSQRDAADIASLQQVNLIVNSVKGDKDEGEDGELYEAMGYIRKSERKSGLTKKKSTPAPAAK